VAKKRKASRSSSAKGSKKKKGARKAAARIVVKRPRTGLESYKQVDFKPLKTHIRAHIERLGKVKEPSPAVANALRVLQQVSDDLSVECQPSMILPTP
jgi:hypothetical protein